MAPWQNKPCSFCAESLGWNWKLVEKTKGRRSQVLHVDCARTIERLRSRQSANRTYFHQWAMFNLYRFMHERRLYVIFS